MLKCIICGFETDKQIKLSKHTSFFHKLKFPDYLIKFKYNGVHPTCGCGCGIEMKYEANGADFNKWKHGHQAKIKGHFGDPKAPKRVDKIISTRKAKFASGEYDHIIKAISKTHTNKNVSKSTRDKMSKISIQNMVKKGKLKRSKLEIGFDIFFKLLSIQYESSYKIKSITKTFIYDYYLPEYKCLVEIDGDFWHCNPNTKYALPESKSQIANVKNDKLKNKWAKQNGFKLLRFWETDINTNPKLITETLKRELKLNL
jgi:very-short-patch-repair endonuclease